MFSLGAISLGFVMKIIGIFPLLTGLGSLPVVIVLL